MSYWRKLFIVILLTLSLPLQSFAAVSMKCVTAQAEAASKHVEEATSAYQPGAHDMTVAGDDHRHQHRDNAHHAHSCSACASCCFGTGIPAVPVVSVSLNATRIAAPFPQSVGVVSFLTDGIERPPRFPLV
ncbi:hypothetical protein [Paraburkholderia sp. NMBU_R16]|uniref:hypothetical protein n=1 Tax=Paraburkholderia sp. NMBU_R16 TaxID=2698676 RepID=UPI0020B8E845|nr:hypothetical protein [Paraburkholderia sp. NMBU_R16]